MLDVLRVSIIGAARVADCSEVIAQRAPCVLHLGLESHRTAQGCDCCLAVATGTQRQAELVVSGGPVRLRLRQWLEDRLGGRGIAGTALRNPEQQRGQRMARRDLEDLRRLLGRKPRLRGQHALRMSERCFERSDRF